MPLTLVHPAAVLPLRRCGLPLSALVIGSYAPDMEYWLSMAPQSRFSHTAVGLFAFCLPAGLLALWIYQRIWKAPLVALLDPRHHHHAAPFRFSPLPRFLKVCLALLVGSAIHILLDSFTHHYGWAVQHFDVLGGEVQIAADRGIPLYRLLHHAVTVLCFGLILFMAFYHRRWTWPAFLDNWPLLLVVAWMTLYGGMALGMLVAGSVSDADGLKRWLGSAMVVAGTIQIALTTFLCLLWHVRRWKAKRFGTS